MNVLALDPAKFTGFCYGSPRHGLTFGTWRLGSGAHRLSDLEHQLERVLEAFPDCTVIAYERAASGGVKNFKTFEAHAELAGKIKEVADRHGLECWPFLIQQWKAIGLGSGAGRAKPARYRQLVEIRLGIRCSTVDEAAAIGIWHAAQHGLPVTQKKQAKQLKKTLAKKQMPLFR